MNAPLRPTDLAAAGSARPFRRARRAEERVRVLGAEMDLVRPEEVMWFTAQKVAAGERAVVANHNLHSLYLLRCEPRLAAFFAKADLVEVDSTPIIWWAGLTGRRSRAFHRCTYLDWREMFWSLAAEQGWRVFYLGGAPGVAEAAAASLRQRWPGLRLAVHDGYFDITEGAAENQAVRSRIAKFAPQVLFVGMGMPRQELWIEANADALPPCVMFSLGAAFDYEAGVQSAAPRWMGKLGVEWLYRLVHDPRRLFVRYCVDPWFLLPAALADLIGLVRRRR